MSKITFRADDELVSRLEALEASKSEVMREALRSHLDSLERASTQSDDRSETGDVTIDELVTDRLDQLLAERESSRPERRAEPRVPDINVNVSLEGLSADNVAVDREAEPTNRKTSGRAAAPEPSATSCAQCGETVDDDHVYCPNCGEKATHRLFCECGDEIQSDWGFCPSCGRRTPAADVLDNA
ncbi:double zinc ribbon domain-containing protein [Halohasta litorea]|uniref:Zinc ribbon domain-containing protein n=1 Tax=Halohasta litorea TaxID=869891 RepID=A0ABD6D9C8_9EURY|nr:zinc ribbon domain-containing protein [Halohasta litorea]